MKLVATGKLEDAFDNIPLHDMVLVEALSNLGQHFASMSSSHVSTMRSLDALPDASRLAEVFSAENLNVEGKEGMQIHTC